MFYEIIDYVGCPVLQTSSEVLHFRKNNKLHAMICLLESYFWAEEKNIIMEKNLMYQLL